MNTPPNLSLNSSASHLWETITREVDGERHRSTTVVERCACGAERTGKNSWDDDWEFEPELTYTPYENNCPLTHK